MWYLETPLRASSRLFTNSSLLNLIWVANTSTFWLKNLYYGFIYEKLLRSGTDKITTLLSACLQKLNSVLLKCDIKLIFSLYWTQSSIPSDQNLISAKELKSDRRYENGCQSYTSLPSNGLSEEREEVNDCLLSLSLSLHPKQRSNTSSESESSGVISSSSRSNFSDCSGYSEGPRINLDLSMSIYGP